MNSNLRPLPEQDRPHDSERARVSDLIVAYFIRGIRSLQATPRGQALEARRIWSATPQPDRAGRDHPWG